MIADQIENSSHRLMEEVTYTNMVEVFVDDFIAVTKNPSLPQLSHFYMAMLNGVHPILPPPNVTKHQVQEPIL